MYNDDVRRKERLVAETPTHPGPAGRKGRNMSALQPWEPRLWGKGMGWISCRGDEGLVDQPQTMEALLRSDHLGPYDTAAEAEEAADYWNSVELRSAGGEV